LKLVCNVNIVYGNLKSENPQDYAQKPQRNCTFMNSASELLASEDSITLIISTNGQWDIRFLWSLGVFSLTLVWSGEIERK